MSALPQTSLFSARFRECAGRALLLPRRRPDRRTPLWQQRQRAADLLTVASKYPTFPILLETSRECLQDVFDVPALREVLGAVAVAPGAARPRRHGVVEPDGVEPAVQLDRRLHVRGRRPARRTPGGGALARPRSAARAARRRGAARAARPGRAGRRRARAAAPHRRAPGAHHRRAARRAARGRRPDRRRGRPALSRATSAAMLAELLAQRRAIELAIAGETRFAAADDAARYRDALGCALPVGLPVAFTDPVPRPLEELVARYARTHGPFLTNDVARRLGAPFERVEGAIAALGRRRASGPRRVPPRRRAARVVRPRRAAPAAAPLAGHAAPRDRAGRARCAGALPAGVARHRRRTARYRSAGRVDRHAGRGADRGVHARARRAAGTGGRATGRRCSTSCAPAATWSGSAPGRSAPATVGSGCASPTRSACWPADGRSPSRLPVRCTRRSASCSPSAARCSGVSSAKPIRAATDAELLAALWDLVWAGEVTNDSLAPVRAVLGGAATRAPAAKRTRAACGGHAPGGSPGSARPPAPGAGAWWRRCSSRRPSATEAAHAQALQLLERYGVVTREAVLAEGVIGGFSSVYGVLKVLEERGRARRGYFVAGLGAAQFAVPGAIDRLRGVREVDDDDDRAGAGRHRSGPAVRGGAGVAVARCRRRRPSGPDGVVGGGARPVAIRWRGSTVRRITWSRSRPLPATRGGLRRWRRAWPTGSNAASRCARSTAVL